MSETIDLMNRPALREASEASAAHARLARKVPRDGYIAVALDKRAEALKTRAATVERAAAGEDVQKDLDRLDAEINSHERTLETAGTLLDKANARLHASIQPAREELAKEIEAELEPLLAELATVQRKVDAVKARRAQVVDVVAAVIADARGCEGNDFVTKDDIRQAVAKKVHNGLVIVTGGAA